MTAEVAILNTSAVALAADSAATIGQVPKIYSSVNKLFALSNCKPVGVMFYNYADFLSVPWESIIKIYRETRGDQGLDTLNEYFVDLLSFLRQADDLFTMQHQQHYVRTLVHSYFRIIRDEIDQTVEEEIRAGRPLLRADIVEIAETIIANHHKKWDSFEMVPDWTPFSAEEFVYQHEDTISEIKDQVFGNHRFSPATTNHLQEIAGMLFSRDEFGQFYTGVVVAGFGEKDTFPSLRSCWIGGVIDHKLKLRLTQSASISYENTASLIPFAQAEMVGTFMEGIAPALRDYLDDYIRELFEEYPHVVVSEIGGLNDDTKAYIVNELKRAGSKVFSEFVEDTTKFRWDRNTQPIVWAIEALPKDELASMAESLVSLTSFKRRVSIDVETVGGPIDVAVISKGDGFVWVKRKSYFEPLLNLRHYGNYISEISRKGASDARQDRK